MNYPPSVSPEKHALPPNPPPPPQKKKPNKQTKQKEKKIRCFNIMTNSSF